MTTETIYDTAVIGGGLGGLCLSIQLVKAGFSVILFEKEEYPFHKVCGEYISMESYDFLKKMGLPLDEMQLAFIKNLIITAPDGSALQHRLDMGGFGISRYKLDNDLKGIAQKLGVEIWQKCKVEEVQFKDELFSLNTTNGVFTARICCAGFGKRSNLDVKWKRPFATVPANKLNNFIGIKYHIQTRFPADTIALHNFKDGYCGISKIEENKYCLCYLTNAANLKKSNNSIVQMEKNILATNPHLKNIFDSSTKLYTSPLSISQISFQKKEQVEEHILMIGDAAGVITPLCGNGMSMAMHSSKLAAACISDFLLKKNSRPQMEENYKIQWKKAFSSRLRTGRIVQYFFGKQWVTNFFIKAMKRMPFLTTKIIKKTHGKPF